MIESPPNQAQMSFLASNLMDQLNPKHPLLCRYHLSQPSTSTVINVLELDIRFDF